MKKVLAYGTLLSTLVAMVGCGGNNGQPDWYLTPPKDKGTIYGRGVSEEVFSEQLALETAQLNATKEVSKTMGQTVSNMVDAFLRQSATGTESERNALSQSVGRTLSENTVSGVMIDKCVQGTTKSKNMYKFYCLAKYEINGNLADQLQQSLQGGGKVSNQALLDEFRAKQGFESMRKELESLRQR